MRTKFLYLISLLILVIGIVYFRNSSQTITFLSPLAQQVKQASKPLEKYTFENLKTLDVEKSQIKLEEVIVQ